MKTTLIFSDLHANKRALLDIENIIEDVDKSFFCGDILGYGKDIDYCIDFILDKVDFVVLGNHDRLSITSENLETQHPVVKSSIEFTRTRLSEQKITLLRKLPTQIYYDNIFMTHSLGDRYLETKENFVELSTKSNENTEILIFGHTHKQVLCKFGNKIIINPGSITKGRKGAKRGYVLMKGKKIEFIELEAIL